MPFFHVYIMASKSDDNFVKVGKSNNHNRVPGLIAMHYAGITDWVSKATFEVDSNECALALEHMISAKLSKQGHRRDRINWINFLNKRWSFADECYSCSSKHAIKTAKEALKIYSKYINER